MKNILTLVFALFINANLFAQADIVALEYFVDDDPGLGLGSGISITSGQTIDINHSIDLSALALSSGSHRLYIRAQNANGDWSMIENRSFFILESIVTEPVVEDIVALEYFVDEDPGLGLGSGITIASGQTVDINYSMDLSSLSLTSGQHTLHVRAQSANGDWSMIENRKFILLEEVVNTTPVVADILELEYFIDNDPGQGAGTPISVTTGTDITLSHAIDDDISPGWHTVNVRGKNSDGFWGFSEKRKFYISPPVNNETPEGGDIVAIEYFFNEDPGFGSGGQVPVGPAENEVDLASLDLESLGILPTGMNNVYIRAQNEAGQWGFSESREFEVQDNCTQPIVDFEVVLGCAGEAVTFTDMSIDLQGDATYRWYLDGDEIVDDTNASTSHTFENPGTYTVALAVHQGQICSDSLSMEITIKEKPIVVFSTNPVLLGEPTVFEVEQFYVDAGADWSWDFDSDTTEDDTTEGNNTFTFSTVGTYTTTLDVTDSQGCGTTYSNSVEVLEEIGEAIPNNEITVYAGLDNTFPEITSHQITGIDLGTVGEGELISQTFTIENTGDDMLTISSIVVTDAQFSVQNAPVSVATLTSENFEVTMSSSVVGNFSATILVESDDSDEAIFLFTISIQVTGKPASNLNLELSNMTYGDAPFELMATSDSESAISYISSDDLVISISGTIATLMGAGTCSITAIQESNDIFPATKVIRDVTIQKKALFVFADDLSRVYGASNASFTMKYEGFVSGEGAEVLDTEPIVSTNSNESSPVGIYTIDLSAGDDDDYEIVTSSGELEVTKAELSVTADDQSKVFGASNPALTISYEGFVNGEGFDVIDLEPIATTASDASSPVGNYSIDLSDGSDDNYEIATSNGKLEVIKAELSVTADDQSKVFGASNPELTISYQGFVNDNSVEDITAPTIFTTAIETSVAGDYDIFLNGGASHNYNLTLVNGTMTITTENVLGVAKHESKLSIYPNPATTSISLVGVEHFESLKIYDSLGKLVKEFDTRVNSFPISDLIPGLYVVLVQSTNSIFQQKLQKF